MGKWDSKAIQKKGDFMSNGAQGRNRTTDTAIFSRMLYQLSYLGVLWRGASEGAAKQEAGL